LRLSGDGIGLITVALSVLMNNDCRANAFRVVSARRKTVTHVS
jgi:hypothetical protein